MGVGRAAKALGEYRESGLDLVRLKIHVTTAKLYSNMLDTWYIVVARAER